MYVEVAPSRRSQSAIAACFGGGGGKERVADVYTRRSAEAAGAAVEGRAIEARKLATLKKSGQAYEDVAAACLALGEA